MTKFMQKTFTVGGHNQAFADGWDRIFGTSPLCQCGHQERDHTANAGCIAVVNGYGPNERTCPCGQFVRVP
jgi:hypothetical protein